MYVRTLLNYRELVNDLMWKTIPDFTNYMYMSICVSIYVCAYMHVHMDIHISAYVCICMYICGCAWLGLYVCVVCAYVYACTCK